MKRRDVDIFEKLTGQLSSLQSELASLAKKSPNDAVNEFKLGFINSTLEQANKLLGDRYRPFSDFEKFSAETLPSNSDVTLILSQYIECAEKFRADNIKVLRGWWYWRIDGEDDDPTIRTSPPRKLDK